MSTRAYIGIQNKSGKSISYIYSHSDNYLEGVGKTLLNDYKTRQKVFRLIANGDASFVGPRINPRKIALMDSIINNVKKTFVYSIRVIGMM